jgi:hypothetical protein
MVARYEKTCWPDRAIPRPRPAPLRCSPMITPRSLAILVAVAILAARPAAATPTIALIDPPGAAQGMTVEVKIVGADLAEPRELFFQDVGGIAVEYLAASDNRQVKALLRIAADCPTGPHSLRIRTKEGLSELRTFRVGILSQEPESEPNNEFATAQRVTLPKSIAGIVTVEDVDCFKVHLAAGARIAAAVDALRLDQEMFDPHLELVDAHGLVVAACDDHPLLGPDAMLAVTVAEEGDYIVRLRESAYGGTDGCVYLLHLGDFPVPHLAWPPAGLPGGKVEVEWQGDPEGPFRQTISLPAETGPEGVAEIHPVRDGVASPVAVPLRVSPYAGTAEVEPNNNPDQATPVATAPGALLGRLHPKNDIDWFRIEAAKGSKWHVRAWGRCLGSPIDLVVNIHRANTTRERLTGNDDAEGPDSVAEVTVPEEGAFLVRVNDHQGRGGPDFTYWIEVVQSDPEVHVSVPVGRSNTQERLVAVVPRGNRTAVVLNAARSRFSGAARVSLSSLPAGVRVTVPDAAGNAPATLAVFEAAADAPEATVMAGVNVTAADDGRPLGGLRQKTDLVFGPPNNAVFRTALDSRLPVAVVAEAPIRIELEKPVVPIVRRGTLDLHVRVERLEGQEGKVVVFIPWKPPGIGGPSRVEIPANASEGVYPLSANPDAPLGEWQVALTAMLVPQAQGRGDGEMLVASSLVTLRVAEPLVELAAEATTVEQGQETRIIWKVQKPSGFLGAAKVRLLGLPAKTEAPELELPAAAGEISFPVKVAADAPAGSHKNVFCELTVPMGEAFVMQTTPPMQLRIDKPLPPDEKPETTPVEKQP